MNMLEYFNSWEDIVEFPKKTLIFEEMAPADFMYVILSGEVNAVRAYELEYNRQPATGNRQIWRSKGTGRLFSMDRLKRTRFSGC